MKIYRCNVYDPSEGTCVSWHASRRAAERHMKAEGSDGEAGPESVELVEIPTDKAGLIAWLNRSFTRDNG